MKFLFLNIIPIKPDCKNCVYCSIHKMCKLCSLNFNAFQVFVYTSNKYGHDKKFSHDEIRDKLKKVHYIFKMINLNRSEVKRKILNYVYFNNKSHLDVSFKI